MFNIQFWVSFLFQLTRVPSTNSLVWVIWISWAFAFNIERLRAVISKGESVSIVVAVKCASPFFVTVEKTVCFYWRWRRSEFLTSIASPQRFLPVVISLLGKAAFCAFFTDENISWIANHRAG